MSLHGYDENSYTEQFRVVTCLCPKGNAENSYYHCQTPELLVEEPRGQGAGGAGMGQGGEYLKCFVSGYLTQGGGNTPQSR